MHHIKDDNPMDKKIDKHSWQKPHLENKTGTKEAYKPNKISKKNKIKKTNCKGK